MQNKAKPVIRKIKLLWLKAKASYLNFMGQQKNLSERKSFPLSEVQQLMCKMTNWQKSQYCQRFEGNPKIENVKQILAMERNTIGKQAR